MRQLAGGVIEYEQYLDFMRNRMFRQTLLCRNDVAVDRNVNLGRTRSLFVAANLTTSTPTNLESDEETTFRANAASLTTRSPLMKSCFEILRCSWPKALRFEELLDRSLEKFPDALIAQVGGRERAAQAMATNLIQCFARRIVDLYLRAPPVSAVAGDRPRVSPLARLQAATSSTVTSLLHEAPVLGELDRMVARLADGTRSRQEIARELAHAVRNGELDLYVPGGPAGDQQTQDALEKSVQESLTRLTQLALVCD
jgi:methyltransferase-like protein